MKKDYIEFMGWRLSLKTKEKMQLEDMIGNPLTYLFGMMGGMDEDDMDFTKLNLPPLKVIVATVHTAAQRYEHGMTKDKVVDVIDEYLEQDDKSVITLFTDVFLPLLQQAKYLPEEMKVEVAEEEVQEEVVEVKPAAKKPRAKKTVVEE